MSIGVCAVMNCRQTGVVSLQVTTTNGGISDVKMNPEKVDGLCYPLLFPHGEPGFTNEMKGHISSADYVMARMLMPEKIGRKCMTAPARYYSETQIIDSRTGEAFASDEDVDQVDQHDMQITTNQFLRVNRFILMFMLAQYWLLDFFSCIRDQRLSIIGQMRDQIMMGQPRQTRNSYSVEDALEEGESHGAGYIDEPRRESYLPDSVHGSQRHLSALAKNALVLVSEYGCPHVFLTLTCNPECLGIQSQLINGQTAFDRPDVTVPVFQSRLDKFKTNIRNGKYFELREVIYISHVIEYQYHGLPHAHMVFHVDNAHDIDADNQEDLLILSTKKS